MGTYHDSSCRRRRFREDSRQATALDRMQTHAETPPNRTAQTKPRSRKRVRTTPNASAALSAEIAAHTRARELAFNNSVLRDAA